MSNTNQPLTAHEILIKRYESKFEKYGDPVKAPHYWASQISDYREDILPAMEEYAAQATAALKQEVEELKSQWANRSTDYEVAMNRIKELKRENEKLTKDRDYWLDLQGKTSSAAFQIEQENIKLNALLKKAQMRVFYLHDPLASELDIRRRWQNYREANGLKIIEDGKTS